MVLTAEAERTLWTHHITQWRHSHQTSKDFCDTHGLNPRIFHAWRKKLLREVPKNAPPVTPQHFIPITPSKAENVHIQEIKLELRDGIRLCLPVSNFAQLAQQLREMALL